MINIPKGTKDVLPGEVYRWHHVENVAREVAEAYAFREIRTPVFEHTELFSRGVGDTTDSGRCARVYRERAERRRDAL